MSEPTATIVELENTSSNPRKDENPSKSQNTELEALIAQLSEQENRAIESIREIRKTRQAIQYQLNPPEKKPTIEQIKRRKYRTLAINLLSTLRGMGVSATPKHSINELAIRCDGVSGDGDRQISHFLYFPSHDSIEPEMAKSADAIPDNAVLWAEEAIGYTTVTLKFTSGDKEITVIGKTICSAQDHYNGNLGVILAFNDAINQIKDRNIDAPHILALVETIADFQDMVALHLYSK